MLKVEVSMIIDYKRGLAELKKLLVQNFPDSLPQFSTLEDRFWSNESERSVFGDSETVRSEHARIIYGLNKLSLEICKVGFNELCTSKQSSLPNLFEQKDADLTSHLERIEKKIDQGRLQDQQVALQLLDALSRNELNQAEILQMESDLRAWVEEIQRSGIALSPDLSTKLDELMTPTASAGQYLELALPIIPGILNYKFELGGQNELNLQSLWKRLKNRLGHGANKGSNKL